MAYNRRQQRRQGIRYGPPRAQERFSDNGALIGRFLGLGILLLAVGVLAAGALAFVGDRPGASSTPRRTGTFAAVAPSTATATPSERPTIAASTPAATAIVVPSGPPTPGPTSVPPLVQIGEGFVTFGTKADAGLHILDPRSVFGLNERIVWSAFLTEVSDSAQLRIQISRLDSAQVSGELLIRDDEVTPLVTNAQIFQRRFRAVSLLEFPGVYVVRYVRGTDILSEGYVEITG